MGPLGTLVGPAARALDRYGLRPPSPGAWDAIAVAGCKVMPDGSPSRALDRRVRAAVDLWREGRAPQLVISGGATGGPVTEARAGAALAVALGVPAHAVTLEERARSTAENAAYTAELLGRDARVLVVTCSWHRWRAERMFRRHFAHVGSAGPVPPDDERQRHATREVLAVAASWWRL